MVLPVAAFLEALTKSVNLRATAATRTGCVRHGVGHQTPLSGRSSRNAAEDLRPNILQLNTEGLTANKISVIEQLAYKMAAQHLPWYLGGLAVDKRRTRSNERRSYLFAQQTDTHSLGPVSARFWLISSCLQCSSADWLNFSHVRRTRSGEAMACQRSCSVKIADRRVMSQSDSFVIMLGVLAQHAPRKGAVLLQLCSLWMHGAQNRGSRNCKEIFKYLPSNFWTPVKVAPMARAMPAIP